MDMFFCAGCRFDYPLEKAARITPGAHRDGMPVGFCFVCAREFLPDMVPAEESEAELDAVEAVAEQPASA